MQQQTEREARALLQLHFSWLRASIIFFIIAGWTGFTGWGDENPGWTLLSTGAFVYALFGLVVARRHWNAAVEKVRD